MDYTYTQHNTLATYERVQSQSLYISDPIPFNACACGTERTPLVPRPHLRSEVDVKSLIHTMETEAYASVLKALIAQSDLLSWEKEGLITMLRKELNVTDTEHGELLVKINFDESIKMIRERRNCTLSAERTLYHQVNTSNTNLVLPGHNSYKRLKASPAAAPKSRKYLLHGQPSSEAISSRVPAQFMDEQRRDQLAVLPVGAAQKPMKVVWDNSRTPLTNKVGGPQKSQFIEGCYVPGVGYVKNTSNVIEIRATDRLVQEIERVMYGRKNPDPAQVEKAKLLLREHERALCEALGKVADALDGGQDTVRFHSGGRRVRFIDMSEGGMTLDGGY